MRLATTLHDQLLDIFTAKLIARSVTHAQWRRQVDKLDVERCRLPRQHMTHLSPWLMTSSIQQQHVVKSLE